MWSVHSGSHILLQCSAKTSNQFSCSFFPDYKTDIKEANTPTA